MSDPTSSSRSARNSVSPLETLRQRAEAKLRAVVSAHPNDASPGDLQRLLHELSVHQAELEMQNEELNHAQSALEASRARYFDLYDQAPVGYITFGMDGLVLEANRLAASMLGLAANRLPGRRVAEFVVPAQRPIFSERYAKLLARARPEPCELQLIRADHTRFWAELHMALVFEEPAGGPRCRAAFVDITQRMAMQEGVARLAAIVASSDDAIISQDLDGQVTSWNSGAERMIGYTAGEMIGQELHGLLPPAGDQESPSMQRLRRGEAVPPFESRLTSKSGRAVPVSLSLSVVRDELGRVTGTSIIARDIGELVRAQQALHLRLRQLELLSQTGQTLIMADNAGTDLLTDVFGKLSDAIGVDILLNYQLGKAPASLELISSRGISADAHSRAQVIGFGETLCGLVARSQAALLVNELQLSHFPEAAALAALGARCYAGFPLLARGALAGVVGFAMRGTDHFDEGDLQVIETVCSQVATTLERLRLLRELRCNEQALKEADRRKDDFIATLAHELRNPLAPIYHAVRILELGSGSPIQKDVVEMMERQVGAMVRLVDDLLEVSRVTRGKIDLQRERVELGGILRDAVETSRPLVEAGAHTLTVEIPGEPFVVDADPVRLAQVFANLLNNAAKYTESGGQISLSARRDQHEVEVRVQDSGSGIPTDLLPHVFEMFTQGVPRGRAKSGLGIGLTLARTLVELHGGRVEASSPGIDAGSTFTVRLPLVMGQVDDHASRRAAPTLTSRCRVLLVDDNRDVVDTLGSLLQLLGAEVEVVYDGPSALEALTRFHPTALIVDIGMPGMDGYEVARRVRDRPQGRDLTLIALTGWGQPEDRLRTRRAGFDHHLVKPADLDHLHRLLSRTSS